MLAWFKKKALPAPAVPRLGFFSTDMIGKPKSRRSIMREALQKAFPRTDADFVTIDENGQSIAMDSSQLQRQKSAISGFGQGVNPVQLLWYAGQGFIGYQTAAILSQHWLIRKACTMPARDAVRHGYDITVNDGTEVKPEVLDFIVQGDRQFKVKKHCVDLVRGGRMFGIRICMFLVNSTDARYYQRPFNPDGVTPGSYKGMVQIDPYWITPELSQEAASNPASPEFYEPTWWRINGMRIHRTHLVIFRNGDVPDILKPSYMYGGIPLPQMIYERVYAAERTANEAPMLAMSKRLTTLKIDFDAAIAQQESFEAKMEVWTQFMNNYGVKVIGAAEEVEQYDTSLNDLDAVIMTQYQLVAAIADVPSTKLLGTSPKGFNATGEFESDSYHEFLESTQEHDMSPLLERHHLLFIRSEVVPKFNIKPFGTQVAWRAVDSPTAKEQADINKTKADTDSTLAATGALDGIDIRNRLIADRDSGYSGITPIPQLQGFETEDDEGDDNKDSKKDEK